MATLSETNEWYEALERAVEGLPGLSSRAGRNDSYSLQSVVDPRVLEKLLEEVFPGTNVSCNYVLPTKFDDYLTYSIMRRLIDVVRSNAADFKIDESNFGGFCFAPTGEVMARALPIAVPSQPESKVFIVFDSGLFMFIDGVVRILLGTAPTDFLAGNTANDWKAAWLRDCNHPDRLQAGKDIVSWLNYLKCPNPDLDLAYVSIANFGPNGTKLIHDMVFGTEIFIAAHEFVHAIKSHHRTHGRSDQEVELEADVIGALIAVKAFQSESVNHRYALAGICIFLKSLGVLGSLGSSHPHYKVRMAAVMKAFADAQHLDEAGAELAKMFLWCLDDLCASGKTATAADQEAR